MVKRFYLPLFLTCIVSPLVSAADWPYWRGPDYTGASLESDWVANWPATGPTRLWEAQIGIGFSAITVAEGRIYTMGHQGKEDVISCLDALTGDLLWAYRYAEPKKANLYEGGPNATPTIADKRVYTLSKEGKVFCLDASTGTQIWARDIVKEYSVSKPMWGHSSSPLVLDGVVYLNAGAGGMALRAANGSLIWKNGKSPAGYASLVPFHHQDQLHLLVFAGAELLAVAANTGNILWRQAWKTSWKVNAADPILVGGGVFVASGYGRGCGFFKMENQTVAEVYRNKEIRSQCYGSALYQGHVYGFDGDVNKRSGALVCMNPQTGQVKWREDKRGVGAVSIAGDKLLVLENSGRLTIAKAQTSGFEELASAQILEKKCWTVPTLANGLLYARNSSGHLVCLDLRPKGN